MARTFRHGKLTVLKIDDENGDLQDLSDALRSVDFPETVDKAETSAFGTGAKTYVPGMTDAQLSCSGMFDQVMAASMQAIKGQETFLAFEYEPEGAGVGRAIYTGECFLTSIKRGNKTNDMVSLDLDFQITGDVGYDVQAP